MSTRKPKTLKDRRAEAIAIALKAMLRTMAERIDPPTKPNGGG